MAVGLHRQLEANHTPWRDMYVLACGLPPLPYQVLPPPSRVDQVAVGACTPAQQAAVAAFEATWRTFTESLWMGIGSPLAPDELQALVDRADDAGRTARDLVRSTIFAQAGLEVTRP
jgi:hypothetical protein